LSAISGDAVARRMLEGRSILLVENDSAIRAELGRPFLSAVILDCAAASRERRAIIRRLRERRVPFLIYGVEPPSTVTSGEGAPFVPKPTPPQVLVSTLAALMASTPC